jgi:hypothetical protein
MISICMALGRQIQFNRSKILELSLRLFAIFSNCFSFVNQTISPEDFFLMDGCRCWGKDDQNVEADRKHREKDASTSERSWRDHPLPPPPLCSTSSRSHLEPRRLKLLPGAEPGFRSWVFPYQNKT